ncbi:hypothetical protein [Bartonella jaculi]|uniref:Uncharacterized protein n=1 Tax=Bartonella jaculi TaxID=686226 RepID=A0ABP9N7J3_9HYPH
MTYATNKTGIYGAVNVFYALYVHSQKIDLNKTVKDFYAVRYFRFGNDEAFYFAPHLVGKN